MENRGLPWKTMKKKIFNDHFPGNAGIGAFDDDIPMEEPEVDVTETGAGIAQCAADCESETEMLKF